MYLIEVKKAFFIRKHQQKLRQYGLEEIRQELFQKQIEKKIIEGQSPARS